MAISDDDNEYLDAFVEKLVAKWPGTQSTQTPESQSAADHETQTATTTAAPADSAESAETLVTPAAETESKPETIEVEPPVTEKKPRQGMPFRRRA